MPVRGPVARVVLGPGEWALAFPVSSGPGSPEMARQLRSHGARRPSGSCAIVRVPLWAPSFGGGPAILHYSQGRAVIYCLAGEISAGAARTLGALASRAEELIPVAARAGGGCQVSLRRTAHAEMPPELHPAIAAVHRAGVTAYVCSDLVTDRAADALGSLCTAYLALMAHARSSGAPGR